MESTVSSTLFRATLSRFKAYSPGRPLARLELEPGLEQSLVNLASNEGLFGPFPRARDALSRAFADLNRYPDGGAYDLHAALADRHGVAFEQIAVGAGADGCIDMLSQATLDEGDEIVCGWPSFASYVIYALKQGAATRLIPLVDHKYDLNALLDAVTGRTKIVYICHPNNPTGTMNTVEELDAYFEQVPEHVLTVVDQAYFEYVERPDYPDAIERYMKRGARVVVLRTFSKIYGLAGLRIGYAVAPTLVCAALAKVRRPFDIATPAQVAALASLGDDGELARRRTANHDGLARLDAALRGAGVEPVPSVANFLYVDMGVDARSISEPLSRMGILVRPLEGFGAPTALRVTVGPPDEIDAVAAAIQRVISGGLEASGPTDSRSTMR